MKTKNVCRKCDGNGKPSKVLLNAMVSFNDFGNDAGSRGTTQARVGSASLVDCIKCEDCGHSWVPQNSTLEWWKALDYNDTPIEWGADDLLRRIFMVIDGNSISNITRANGLRDKVYELCGRKL